MEQTTGFTTPQNYSSGVKELGDSRMMGLFKRLYALGYQSFHLRMMIREAGGAEILHNASHEQYLTVIASLEKYEQLGTSYQHTYSK